MTIDLNQYNYIPAIRSSTYNLGAIKELYPNTQDKVLPLIILRGDSYNDIQNFLTAWGDKAVLIDSSRYPSDISNIISAELNDPTNHFKNKSDKFAYLKSFAKNLIPVVGYTAADNIRDLVQLTLNLFKTFEYVAIKLNVATDSSNHLMMLQTILAALSDSQLQKLILLIDYGKIQSIADVSVANLTTVLAAIKSYKFALMGTLSTSYPSTRPPSGSSINHPLLDPIWQNIFRIKAAEQQHKVVYGDYSATDPTTEALEFDFAVHPIPYATYLLDYLEWFTARDGAGGEYEKFRDIAVTIRGLTGYHGDTFCWANCMIKDISNHSRAKAGNQAFWNKIKINQHISAITHAINAGSLQTLGLTSHEDDSEE